ncbi:HdeD family acid-resistance protein [Microvirga puerhi]|uniref:DUF308 domain-containing protein n=1 Tax=Microvirga puerhi TaxID=2876078 RepID=A0ABS7VR28_9HYPH|nr:DUF308 domain-containing protein [Microvirga puerhi]MBZ6078013.1 DUF308 domain-containing protein [Microvirga puerhi]
MEFLVLGVLLVVCGVAAMLAPHYSTVAASTILGSTLTFAGAATMLQAMRVRHWAGFSWQMVLGAVEVVGGIFIVLTPMKGAAAIALLIAIVLFVQGVTQMGVAVRTRPAAGWSWLLGASLATILIGAALVVRFPYAAVEAPGAMAGVALALGGLGYIMIAVGLLKAKVKGPS